MGFSIGSFLGSIAPAIGGFFGGPAGAAIGAGVGALLGGVSAPRARAPAPLLPAPSVGPMGFAGPGFDVTRRRVGLTGMVARGVGGAALTVLGIAELLRLSRETTGQVVTRQKIVDAVKHCGIELAASMFGLSETEICQIVISRGRRRGRGISASDLRRTRSTIRKVHNISHDLKALSPPIRRHHK